VLLTRLDAVQQSLSKLLTLILLWYITFFNQIGNGVLISSHNKSGTKNVVVWTQIIWRVNTGRPRCALYCIMWAYFEDYNPRQDAKKLKERRRGGNLLW